MMTPRTVGALVCVVTLSACAERPFQRSAGVSDSTCIRQASVADSYLWEAVRDCGARLPDLSDDPGLQRQASLSGVPFRKETHEADGKTHAYVCRGAPPAYERMDTPFPSVGRCTALGS